MFNGDPHIVTLCERYLLSKYCSPKKTVAGCFPPLLSK